MRRALSYPLKLIAKNAGVNGSVVVEKVGFLLLSVLSLWYLILKPLFVPVLGGYLLLS